MTLKNIIILCLGCIIILTFSCKKILDEKPNQKLTFASSVQDLQALMENNLVINQTNPPVSESASDNYYLTNADYKTVQTGDSYAVNSYTWESNNMFKPNTNEWVGLYKIVGITNIVLNNLDQIPLTTNNAQEWKNTKANALFIRAYQFLNAVEIWSLAYDEKTAEKDLGIPLRTSSDINIPSNRATNKDVFSKIITDVQESLSLFSYNFKHPISPSKAAAFALLSRTYLYMQKYDLALSYADSALKLHGILMDYNNDTEVFPNRAYPFQRFNKEDIYDGLMGGNTNRLLSIAKIDTVLYSYYDSLDTRKKMYFTVTAPNQYKFIGHYSGGATPYSGLSVSEMYLNRAECYARMGNVDFAMKDLNSLLIKRYRTNRFTPFIANTKEEAIDIILKERRKELVMRGRRWSDIKRLNKDDRNIQLKRIIDNKTFTLQPNSLKFALPLPEDVILLTGMKQN